MSKPCDVCLGMVEQTVSYHPFLCSTPKVVPNGYCGAYRRTKCKLASGALSVERACYRAKLLPSCLLSALLPLTPSPKLSSPGLGLPSPAPLSYITQPFWPRALLVSPLLSLSLSSSFLAHCPNLMIRFNLDSCRCLWLYLSDLQ